jgi:hypothetical protein
MRILAHQPAPSIVPAVTFEPVSQNPYTPTPQITSTPAVTEISSSLDAGEIIKQNSMVVVAFVISFSVLVAGIAGVWKEERIVR